MMKHSPKITQAKRWYDKQTTTVQLIVWNVLFFVILNIFTPFLNLILAFNSNFSSLYLPWRFVSYMFVHNDIQHLLFNMLMLYFSGQLFERFLGVKHLIAVYILGGVCGAILFFLTHITSPNVWLMGSSAGVIAVFISVACYLPNYKVALYGIIDLPLYVLAIVLVAVDILSLNKFDGISHIAHIGGGIWGVLFALYYKKGIQIDGIFFVFKRQIISIFSRRKMKIVYQSNKDFSQKRLDDILNKIKTGGYEILTNEERDFLQKH